ncbi:MAG: VIT1/CCC1 transporter family protein, partial [Parcubacteria group bacterium]
HKGFFLTIIMDLEHEKELSRTYKKTEQKLRQKGSFSLQEFGESFHQRTGGRYIGDTVFGASDGIVTTFAIVAGSIGGGLSPTIVLILGFANLMADGVSMALGNYLGKKSEQGYRNAQKVREAWELKHHREREINETRDILSKYGFSGQDLEKAVSIVSSNESAWMRLMIREHLGIIDEGDGSPARHGLATFFAFLVAGLAPLLPYVFPLFPDNRFMLSIVLSGVTLFVVGSFRSRLNQKTWWRSGAEMLLVGAIASSVAFFIGKLIESLT